MVAWAVAGSRQKVGLADSASMWAISFSLPEMSKMHHYVGESAKQALKIVFLLLHVTLPIALVE